MSISLYDSNIFSSLPDFRTASHSLERMRGGLQMLGQEICRHNLEEHIGVSLLHKHFSILPNEQLVKYFIGNRACVTPCPQSISDNLIPYLWKCAYDQTTRMQSFYPLEFILAPQRTSRSWAEAQKFIGSEIFLAAFSAKLCELGLADIFGPCIRHSNDEILLGESEILLETTDIMNRILTVAPTAKKSVETTETSWLFLPNEKGDSIPNCQVLCVCHCEVHPE